MGRPACTLWAEHGCGSEKDGFGVKKKKKKVAKPRGEKIIMKMTRTNQLTPSTTGQMGNPGSMVRAQGMKRGVRIIECSDPHDPGSEGRLLQEVFRLMNIRCELVRAESTEELIAAVSDSKYKYVHVSTHGFVEHNKSFEGWWSRNGIGTRKAFAQHEGAFARKCLVSTACKSGVRGFGEHVVGFLGAQYYIAPNGSPLWHNAALFSHIFYFKLFRTKGTFAKAFSSYAKVYKNPHKFRLFRKDAL
jgi:hypothetical protein